MSETVYGAMFEEIPRNKRYYEAILYGCAKSPWYNREMDKRYSNVKRVPTYKDLKFWSIPDNSYWFIDDNNREGFCDSPNKPIMVLVMYVLIVVALYQMYKRMS